MGKRTHKNQKKSPIKASDPSNAPHATPANPSFHDPFRQQLKALPVLKATAHPRASTTPAKGRDTQHVSQTTAPKRAHATLPSQKKSATPPQENHHAQRDEQHAFLSAMTGVTPLGAKTARVAPVPQANTSAELNEKTHEDALALVELQELIDGQGSFRLLTGRWDEQRNAMAQLETSTDDRDEDACTSPHSGAARGVNNALLSQLRQGGFAYHRTLDLHGLTRDAAHHGVSRFLLDARRGEERCVLIITGRGHKSPGGMSVLREALPIWLSTAPLNAHVLAFTLARPEDGGSGAFYVLLRRYGRSK